MLCREIIAVCSEDHTKHINVRHGKKVEFLEAFAKFRKSTMSSVMSVCPSIRIEQLGSHWTCFHEISYLSIFGKSVEKIQVSLRSDKNNCTLHEDLYVHSYGNTSLNSYQKEKCFRKKTISYWKPKLIFCAQQIFDPKVLSFMRESRAG